jgi:N-acetylglucosamine-6-phosphate deacetylase
MPFDLQLNGYAGLDFGADDLTPAALRRACERIRADGGGTVLATIITDAVDRLTARLTRLADAIEADPFVAEVVTGIHVEGPFIRAEKGYVGAHPPEHAVAATVEAARTLVAAGRGHVRLVTLAPERDAGFRTTAWLADQGIVVFAGHCDPSLAELEAAAQAGLAGFTHLGNACPHLLPRHDNIIQRVLACDALRWITFIPDRVHVPIMALGNYLRLVGLDRAIAVTDSTAAAGMGPGTFQLGSQLVVVGADGAAWSEDRTHLCGATVTMARAAEILATDLGFSATDVERLIDANPRRAVPIPRPG